MVLKSGLPSRNTSFAGQPFVPVQQLERKNVIQGCRGHVSRHQSTERGKRGASSVVYAINFDDTTPTSESLLAIAGAVGAAGIAGIAYYFQNQQNETGERSQPQRRMSSRSGVKRKNAVIVFGATGKMGQNVVRELLKSGRQVVAAVRSSEKSAEVFADLSKQYRGQLIVEAGVDVTDVSSIGRKELWRGVSQAAICVGPVFGRQENGEMGYKEGMNSEKVDAQGVTNIVQESGNHIQRPVREDLEKIVIPLKNEKDLANWEKIDDVIMGGKSSSKIQSGPGQTAVWTGNLNIDGGGFCGTRNKKLKLDLSEYDGIQLRVKGDNQIYKINLKTTDKPDNPEDTYAATFSTTGDWQTIRIPFREFVAVTRAKSNPNAPPLETRRIAQIGFRLSRFDFNNLPNPQYEPGPFRLEFDSGISAYKDERPAIVMVSSAAVERNALIGDDLEARKKDIPIVQLNPGGILNYKYKGEMALRSSGLPYSVIRPVGLTTEREDKDFTMEASQGDTISGKVSRAEVATVISAALQAPSSRGKTLEVRRSEAEASRGKKSSSRDLERLFLDAVEDWQRPKRNLPPMPMVAEVPPPPSKERVSEILADPRVREAAERARSQNKGQNGSVPGGAGQGNTASSNGSSSNGASAQAGTSNGSKPGNAADARGWIE